MATTTLAVTHGRRRGTTKDIHQEDISNGSETDARQVAIVTNNEWTRIKDSLTRKQQEEEKVRRERSERIRMHETSRNIVKHWENTIEGQRQKKLQSKRIREEKEEEEKKKVDVEEAKFQAQKRKEAIEHAKTLQYYQTDRVKGFHGALLLTEVLRERDAQVEYKKKKQESMKGRDVIYVEKAREDYEKGLLDDHEQAAKRVAANKTVADFQKQQITERRDAFDKLRHEDIQEGKTIQQDVSEFYKKRTELEEKKHQEKIELQQTLLKALDEKKEIEAMKKRDEEEQDEEIRLFVEAKKKMMRMRKEQERALFKQFQDYQGSMVGRLAKQMQTKVDDEDKRIAEVQGETETKKKLAMKAKEQQLAERQKAIHEHRAEMMAENRGKKKEEEERDIEMLKQRIELDMKFRRDMMEKEKKKRETARELSSFRFEQIEQRHSVEEQLRAERAEFDKKRAESLKTEEEQFKAYAAEVLQEAEKSNSCMKPLQAAVRAGAGGGRGPHFDGLQGLRPSFQAMDETGVQLPSYCQQRRRVQGRPSDQLGSTQKRMGFTW
ncbi:cilia- and flagella- associated protein 210-like [Corticium candelabrum]|uniref:cilia- and flagella- associated protein 210-like n=1 Tax=Corticium candelabrum TaxID=121492 RepID=UPI002E257E43|nr:cilia- and flagella- associated protein 210-like [Corticium candelabrum]